MLSLIWMLARVEPSVVALGLVLAETAVTQDTTIAWSIASAAVVGALGVGVTVGVFKNTVKTLSNTVSDLQAKITKTETELRSLVTTEETTRETEAKACMTFQADTRVTLAELKKDVGHLQKHLPSSSPRSRGREHSGPTSR